jgi:transposase-like protein
MKDFKNFKELMEQLSDEKVCRDFVEQMRWKGNPICPHCGTDKPYKLKDGKAYRCRNKTCKKDFSVTVGTVFASGRSFSLNRMIFFLRNKKTITDGSTLEIKGRSSPCNILYNGPLNFQGVQLKAAEISAEIKLASCFQSP